MTDVAKKVRSKEDIEIAKIISSIKADSDVFKVVQSKYTYEQGLMVFNSIARKKYGIRVVDQYNKLTIENLIKYFMGIPCELDPFKGIMLHGAYGRGKSTIMEVFQEFRKRIDGECLNFKMQNCQKIVAMLLDSKDYSSLYGYSTESTCFDDLGREMEERKIVNIFQNTITPLSTIIDHCWNAFQHQGRLFHFTTNLTPSAIKDAYDGRALSAIMGMCNFVCLAGPDRRAGKEKIQSFDTK